MKEDGYTQPIVTWKTNGHCEVVDGFHRNRVGKECPAVRKRVKGYLPVTTINESREAVAIVSRPRSATTAPAANTRWAP